MGVVMEEKGLLWEAPSAALEEGSLADPPVASHSIPPCFWDRTPGAANRSEDREADTQLWGFTDEPEIPEY